MKKLRIAVFALTLAATVTVSARPARADDNLTRNLLIGAAVGVVVGGVVGLIVYLIRDDPAPAKTARINPPTWATVGLGPLPGIDTKKHDAEPTRPAALTGLLTF
jgi:hypothetical protein